MGKWILYGLVILNLFAFLWFYSKSEDSKIQPKLPTKALLNSDKIAIVKTGSDSEPQQPQAELPSEAQLQDEQAKISNQNENEEDPLQAIINQKAERESSLESNQNQQQTPSTQVATTNTSSNVIPTTTDLVLQDSIANPTNKETEVSTSLTTQTEEQKLLDEMASFASNQVATPTAPAVLPMLCYQYGPLNQTQAEAISAVMQQQQIPMVQQSRILVEPRGFLVLIMPQANSNAAKSEMRAARKAGLDAFTITKGEWNNGVSLGIFSTKSNADKLFNRAKGLIPKSQVSIKKRVRESEVYRILFKLENEQDPAILLANNPFPRFNSQNPLQNTTKIAKKSCETVEF